MWCFVNELHPPGQRFVEDTGVMPSIDRIYSMSCYFRFSMVTVAIQMKFIVMVIVLPGMSAFVAGHVDVFSSCLIPVKPVRSALNTILLIWPSMVLTCAIQQKR